MSYSWMRLWWIGYENCLDYKYSIDNPFLCKGCRRVTGVLKIGRLGMDDRDSLQLWILRGILYLHIR